MCHLNSHSNSVIVDKVTNSSIQLNHPYIFEGQDTISPNGLTAIIAQCRIMLDKHYAANNTDTWNAIYPYYDLFDVIGDDLVTTKGKFTNRLSKYLRETFDYKMTNDDKTSIGNLTNIHRTPKQSYTIVFSDDLWIWDTDNYDLTTNDNGAASCYRPTGCYHNAFQAIMHSPDYVAMKLYNGQNEFVGRAWVYITHDEIVLFNSYGVQLRNVGAMLTTIFPNLTQHEIDIDSPILYINGGYGLLLTQRETPRSYVRLCPESVLLMQCTNCGEYTDESEDEYNGTYIDGQYICESCLDYDFIYCGNCNDYGNSQNAVYANGQWYCEYCAQNELTPCDNCEDYITDEDCSFRIEGENIIICEHCYEYGNFAHCDGCGDCYTTDDLIACEDGTHYCPNCAESEISHCANCEIAINSSETYGIGGQCLCFTCWDNAGQPVQPSLFSDETMMRMLVSF